MASERPAKRARQDDFVFPIDLSLLVPFAAPPSPRFRIPPSIAAKWCVLMWAESANRDCVCTEGPSKPAGSPLIRCYVAVRHAEPEPFVFLRDVPASLASFARRGLYCFLSVTNATGLRFKKLSIDPYSTVSRGLDVRTPSTFSRMCGPH